MATETPLADGKRFSSASIGREQIEDLVRMRLSGKKIDIVAFVSDLLALIPHLGNVHYSRAVDEGLSFTIGNGEPFQVNCDRSRGNLRSMCANLSVRCNESAGQNVSIYGGEGVIREVPLENAPSTSKSRRQWVVRYMNTTDDHWFHITAQ